MKRLILVRHGETDWNLRQKIMGWQNTPINDVGKQQAKHLARYLQKNYSIDKIITSDLLRTKQTIQIIQENGFPNLKQIDYIKELRERKFGKFEGENYNKIKNRAEMEKLNSFDIQHKEIEEELGTESLIGFQQRVVNYFLQISLLYASYENLLMIAHGGTNRMILGFIKKLSLLENSTSPRQTNCCLNDLVYNNHWKIKLENFTDYLKL